MRISCEAIHQSLYVQGRGALRRELSACLRSGRTLRVPRAASGAEANPLSRRGHDLGAPRRSGHRAVPGHREGDLILGLRRSAIGTLVERATRFTILLHLPPDETRMAERARTATGVRGAVMGHGADAVRDAIAAAIADLPAQLRRSLTWDQGAEMARRADLRIEHDLPVYFCNPNSPWQRRTNGPQTAPASVLPEGHGPRRAWPRRTRCRSRRSQRQTAKDAGLENTRRSPGRTADDRAI